MTALDSPPVTHPPVFPADVDPATIRPEDLPEDGYGELEEIAHFEQLCRDVEEGRLTEDEFRPLRLQYGCYGIRQSETHMNRIKAPLGRFNARQFEAMAVISERWSRGHGHLTTRQAVQFHFVDRKDVGDVMRISALAGLTMREACGNAVRNVTMSPLVGIHPEELLDTEAAGDELVRALLRHPSYQVLPRKFKIAFSATTDDDCGTGFHDIGVLPALGPDGEPGYRIVVGGGLGSSAREAIALEPWTPAEYLLPTALACLDLFEAEGERKNRIRARMKFLVKKKGAEAFLEDVLARRQAYIDEGVLSTVVPHAAPYDPSGLPAPTDLPAELADRDVAAYRTWLDANTMLQRSGDAYAVFAPLYLGDLTTEQFRGMATVMRTNDIVDARLTIRQNVVLRDVAPERLPAVWAALADMGLDRPFGEKSGDVVSCPGAETCNLAITASRGLGAAVTDELAARQLDVIDDVAINISGCPNSCGQHQAWDIGFSGMAKHDADGNEAPAYRVYVGGRPEDGGARFGDYVSNVPAKHAPEAAARILDRYRTERAEGEALPDWYDRIGGKAELKDFLADLKDIPDKVDDESYYTDFGNTEAFEVILGQGECA